MSAKEALGLNPREKTLDRLYELGNLSDRRTRVDQAEHALRAAQLITEADAALMLPPSARRGERLVLHAGSSAPAVVRPQTPGSEVARLFTEDCRILAVPDLSNQPRWAAGDGCPGVEAGPVLYAPLHQPIPEPGYIAVYRRYGRAPFGLADSRIMLLLAAWLGLALENLRLSNGLEKTALTDGLTEVYNARFLRTALRREIRRAGRFGQELSLLLVELDQLEAFQAEHGEPRASALLREFASLLAGQVRSFDLVARARGDTFMLILPQTGNSDAREVAERIRAAVERREFSGAPAGAITGSFGVASFPHDGADDRALAGVAERALVQARRRGPNSVYSPDRAARPELSIHIPDPIRKQDSRALPKRS